ncbi:hypothetical protein [Gimesia maris]|uniref:hypothetical protein n=1 Tax=Gimesia maris TaxID=122 RepID=UPI0032ECDB91
MTIANGWISTELEKELLIATGGEISVLGYFQSHATLLLKICAENETDRFVICVMCRSIQILPKVSFEKLYCKKTGNQEFLLYSRELEVRCGALRVEATEFMQKWMKAYGFDNDRIEEAEALRLMRLFYRTCEE